MQSSSQFDQPQACPTKISINKVKPWVFRPKKVIYSLDDFPSTRKQFSKSHWCPQENQRYVDFLLKFKSVIEGGKKNRRRWHLNRMMSKAIGTRSHEQCRSHHQKMIKHYKSVEGIIEHIQKGNTEDEFSQKTPEPVAGQLFQENVNKTEDQLLSLWHFDRLNHSVEENLPFFFDEESLI